MSESVNIYITDKTGGKFFKTNCSVAYMDSVVRDLQRHLDQAANQPLHYSFLDLSSAKIVDDLEILEDFGDYKLTDEDLLSELLS